jgi:flagellar motor switch/type III secretory pathway protein FliN
MPDTKPDTKDDTKSTPETGLQLAQTPITSRWAAASLLPCTLSVDVIAPGFTIGDLLDLEPGSIINARHASGNPVPVWVNGVRIGWAEFDVIGKRVAVRITEVC